jgi:hypothetical protein
MERKFITDELIKVANVLDEMGLVKEANNDENNLLKHLIC